MTASNLWPETEPGTFAEFGSVFDTLPDISVLIVPLDIPAERVDEWIAIHRKPARLEIHVVHED